MRPKRPISVALRGGLGNQLFCWAAGFSLSAKLGRKLLLLGGKIRRTDHHILDPRTFELDYFGLEEATSWQNFSNSYLKRKLEFRERGFEYDPRFEQIQEPVHLEGYFQSWRYFQDVQQLISDALISKMSFSPQANAVWQEIRHVPWVGVHVRRGDYEKVGVMALPDHNYYQSAIQRAQGLTGATEVFVFSDDISAARKVVPLADRYFGPDEVSRPGDVLNFLSRADALVGANSTLSWWAGFLNRRAQAPRIFPREWFSQNSEDLGDLLPPSWEKL